MNKIWKKFFIGAILLCNVFIGGCKETQEWENPQGECPIEEQISMPPVTVAAGVTRGVDGYSWELPVKPNFKIMIFADIQVATMDELNENFDLRLDKLVEMGKPDLIVLTGDNVQWYATEEVVDGLIARMERYDIFWAPVFGNHDTETGITKAQFTEKFAAAEHCLFLTGEKEIKGVGNYVIHLMREEKPVYSLFFIDGNAYRGDGYDYIYPSQIAWYERAVCATTERNGGEVVPSLAFFHIELPEFQSAYDAYLENPTDEYCDVREKICPPDENTGLFDKMCALNSTKAVFCGHDHRNCFDLEYRGIRLNFSLKSSTGSYYDKDMLGATTVTIKEDNSIAIERIFL